jgi:serine phosphatase RsbU (regulator of sigma subunit)
MKYWLIVVFINIFIQFFPFSAFGQSNKLDSLWSIYASSKVDTVKVKTLFSIGDEHKTSNPDSAFLFYRMAIDYANKAKLDTIPYAKQKANLLRNLGGNLRRQSNYDKAISFINYALALYTNLNDDYGQAQCHQNLGNVYFNKGNFDVALEHYFKALKIYETINNDIGIADCYNNIGSAQKEMESFNLALDYHVKARDIFERLTKLPDFLSNDAVWRGLANTYNNIGVAYWHLKNTGLAILFYEKSLEIKNELGDKPGVAMGYNNIAIVYASSEQYLDAVAYFEKSHDVYTQLNNLYGLALVNGNIAYLKILQSDLEKQPLKRQIYLNQALENALKSFDIALEIGALSLQIEAAGYISTCYEKLGRFKEALHYANIDLKLQKEMFSNEKANAIAETSAKYESEKNQLLIENLAKEQEIYKRRVDRQHIIITFIVLIIVLLGFFITALLKLLNQRKEANHSLTEKNEEILQQKEEILTQVDELEHQRNVLELSKEKIENLYLIALDQKSVLEKQKSSIDDSIRYAHFIQSAILPDLDVTLRNSSLDAQSYFVMFRPKDVVSGDFYWATKVDEWLIVAVVDCTGHGVPGAFMSMLGISFLNEIVLSADNIKPAKILSLLRTYIIGALKQKDDWDSQRDGMEMSIVSINTKTKQCFWAGANRPLWIVRGSVEDKKDASVPVVEEIKPNPIPVAVHFLMSEFTNHEIQLNEGDKLYLFSDGFPDQFGGPDGKKFNMYKAFRNLIAQTSNLPMREQGKLLEDTFDLWINYNGTQYEQIDDVTVLGIMV